MDSNNVITADEMAAATDINAPMTPAKFLPYRKLYNELGSIADALSSAEDHFDRLNTMFELLVENEDSRGLARAGVDLAVVYGNQVCEALERAGQVLTSAKATLPRKRWDDSGAPDDRADDDDLAREAAASVPPANDGGGG
jgi:hypothetical protein